jgi:L-ascorbate metabolism protein UlaG (beta-lactamase superfamily)
MKARLGPGCGGVVLLLAGLQLAALSVGCDGGPFNGTGVPPAARPDVASGPDGGPDAAPAADAWSVIGGEDRAADVGVDPVAADRPAPPADVAVPSADAAVPSAAAVAPLEVRFLGVGGFSFRHGASHILTAPLYTNPDMITVQIGSTRSDPAIIDRFLDGAFVADVKAILSGHAHYDHLLDVPHVWSKTDGAMVYGNRSARYLMLAAGLPADRLVALNDPAAPLVDRRSCDEADECTGVPSGNRGDWVAIPGTSVRLRALCSSHPAQIFGIFHFGEGCVSGQPAQLPDRSTDWKEGATLAYLIDFLDPVSGAPVHRIYYQDAPTAVPVGLPHPELLADKRVDLAVLNVGSSDVVEDHPRATIEALDPRYVIGGHWENFFRTQDQGIEPLPLQPSPDRFDQSAVQTLGTASEAAVVVDGTETAERYFRPVPGTDFRLPAAD